jgi:hypothetical protein
MKKFADMKSLEYTRFGGSVRMDTIKLAAMRGETVSLEYPDGHWRLVED